MRLVFYIISIFFTDSNFDLTIPPSPKVCLTRDSTKTRMAKTLGLKKGKGGQTTLAFI